MENKCCLLFRRTYLTLLCGNHFESFIGHQSNRTPRTIIPRFSIASATGEDQTNYDSQGGGHYRSSSHSYNRYNRSSYEHKRNRTQRDRGQQQSMGRNETPMSNVTMSHYQRLNIKTDADLDTIKSAYYSLSKIYHPDIADPNDKSSVEKFRLITESYNTLSDTQLRAEYDREINVAPVTNYNSEIFNQSGDDSHGDGSTFRVRDADMLFRSKQESAMERDKRLNPKKYRAGSFRETPNDINFSPQEEIYRLKRRIDKLATSVNNSSKTKDNFYQTHLYIAIRRRHDGLMEAQNMKYDGGSASDTGIFGVIAGLGIIGVIGICFFNILVDYDIGSYLDDNLVFVKSKPDKQEDEEKEKPRKAI